MKICIKTKEMIKILLLFILFFCICERFYNNTRISGKYSFFISILLLSTSFIIKYISEKKMNIIKIIGIFPIILYGLSTETIRYGIFFLSIYLWGTIKFNSIIVFNKIILLTGVIFSIIQILQGYPRISGFMYSPTIFSCNLVIIVTYFLFEKNFKISNFIYIIIAICMIYLSESSSALLCAVGLILYKIIINLIFYKKEKIKTINKNKTRFIKVLILIGGVITAYCVFSHLEEFLSIIPRSNRDASTLTRSNYLNLFIDQLKQDKGMLMVGRGGGYTQYYIRKLIGTSIFYPLHQDILMLICEYGLIGLIYLYILYLKDLKLNWIIWVIIILCSFHNLVLSPTTICLIVLCSNSLNMQYDNKTVIWH